MSESYSSFSDTKLKPELEIDKPKLYKVLIHNDHYTTMEFVIEVLVTIFQKKAAEATKLMLDVHHKGAGLAGLYTLDIAKTKTNQANGLAKKRGFPLKTSYEAE
jgi:ATP-dependent Clp protease adaptor protein ClpS